MKCCRLALVLVSAGLSAACGSNEGSAPVDTEPEDVEETGVVHDIRVDGPGSIPLADAHEDLRPDGSVDFYQPQLPGPFGVGFRILETRYVDPVSGIERHIPISIWYPTDASSGTPAYYQNLVARENVFENAELADTGRALPTLVFSHGNGSLPEQSFFMTEHWATHGWLVAAPEHIGNSVFDGLNDEAEIMYRRPLDVTATLDALADLPATDPLAGRLSDEIVASGHSFGGYTTLTVSGAGFDTEGVDCEASERPLLARLFCELRSDAFEELLARGFLDERIDVAIPQAPGGVLFFGGDPGSDGLANIRIPTLLMTGALDQALPDDEEGAPIWQSLIGESNLRFHLLDAGHYTFSNMCALLPALAAGDGCGPEFVTPEVGLQLINAYSLAFARWHLWGDERAGEFLSAAPTYEGLELSWR